MSLINCEINLLLTWLENCFIMAGAIENQVPIFTITDMKLDFPVATSSTNNNAKQLQQLKTGFKRTISWNKY